MYLLEGPGLRKFTVNYVVRGAMHWAAEANDLEFVQWATGYELPNPNDTYRVVLKGACKNGHIQVAQCLLAHMEHLGLHDGPSTAVFEAAESGKLEMVQWLYEEYGAKLFRASTSGGLTEMDVAAQEGHLEVLQFLHRINLSSGWGPPRCTKMAMDAAAGAGHLDVVKWLHFNRTEGCTKAAMDWAATNGHLGVVKWLHFNRTEGCTVAAMDGVAARSYPEPDCRRDREQDYRGRKKLCCTGKRPDSLVKD